LTGFYVTAFPKQTLLQNTGGTRPDLRHARSFQASGQLSHQTHIAGRDRHDTNLGRRRRSTRTGRRRITFAASSQKQ